MKRNKEPKVSRKLNLAGTPATLYGHVSQAVRDGEFFAHIRMQFDGGNEVIIKQAGAYFDTEVKAWTWCHAAIAASGIEPTEVH